MTAMARMPDGASLAYEIRSPSNAQDGEGTIVLVRPLGGSMTSWGTFRDALAARFRVIAFDARGTGESSATRLVTTTRAMARDLRALLDVLGVSRTHVYGISLGGMVASWLAIDAPGRVDRLVLASTTPKGTMYRARAASRGLTLMRCLAQPAARAESCLATRILSNEFRRNHPREVAAIRAQAAAHPASHLALLALLGAAARHDAEAHLKEISADTLVLVGEHDPLLTHASQRELVDRIPHTRFEMVAGAGHDVSVEAPLRVAERVIAHFAPVRTPS
jgi:3-oxoadipate enol-lactonase